MILLLSLCSACVCMCVWVGVARVVVEWWFLL
eukprot:COSAG06_NODE_59384_length_274_cov_0.754286_1_plen_31_part_10